EIDRRSPRFSRNGPRREGGSWHGGGSRLFSPVTASILGDSERLFVGWSSCRKNYGGNILRFSAGISFRRSVARIQTVTLSARVPAVRFSARRSRPGRSGPCPSIR